MKERHQEDDPIEKKKKKVNEALCNYSVWCLLFFPFVPCTMGLQ